MRKLMTLVAVALVGGALQPATTFAQKKEHPAQAEKAKAKSKEKTSDKVVYAQSDADRLEEAQRRRIEVERRVEEQRRIELQRRIDEQRREELQRRIEAQRRAEQQRRIEQQRRDDDRYDDRRRDSRDDDIWYENRRERDDRSMKSKGGKAGGPAFCRSGAGHPVHGRQWCVDKGFGLGGNARWDRVRWEDVIFRRPQSRTSYEMGRDVLQDVLGTVVFGRLDARRRTFGINEPLNGRWVNDGDRSVLLVNAGAFPLAELIDNNRDRHVDLVLVNFGR